MSDLRDIRALFEAKAASSDGEAGPRKPGLPAKPSPLPPTNSRPNQHPHPGDKVRKLSPAVLKTVGKSLDPGRGLGSGGVTGGGGVRVSSKGLSGSNSPAVPKKKPAVKHKGTNAAVSPRNTGMQRLNMELLANAARAKSVSTGALDSIGTFSHSPSKLAPTPAKYPKPTSHSAQTPRKEAALSMDATGVHSKSLGNGSWEKPTRPLSARNHRTVVSVDDSHQTVASSPHRVLKLAAHDDAALSLSSTSLRRSSAVVSSTSGSPAQSRLRSTSTDAPGEVTHPSSPSSTKPLSPPPPVITVCAIPLSRSHDDLLEAPSPARKPRSHSDQSETQQAPSPKKKPTLPPKKPGFLSRSTISPPPPPKPSLGQMKSSSQFNKHVSSRDAAIRSTSDSTSPELVSHSALIVMNASLDRPDKMSSPSPKSTVSLDLIADSSSDTFSPIPTTACISSQSPMGHFEAKGVGHRNADSGFASETAEEIVGPNEHAPEQRGAGEGGGVEGGEGRGEKEEAGSEPNGIRVEGEGRGGVRGIGEEKEERRERDGQGVSQEEEEEWDEARLQKARQKRQHIAEELLKTEETYVERLQIIAEKFHGEVVEFSAQNKQVIPEVDINKIFLNIPQIYNLNLNLRDDLRKRMDTWANEEGLGDVIARLAPFLKLYAHYTSGFEDAMKLLTHWTKKEKKFDVVVKAFERELATGLGVAHYMLEPVQRIPRYRLLLADYLKYLPPNSPDKLATRKALNIISEAADHSNSRIKELENSNTILSIQRSLQDYEGTLLSPGRLFICKGQLQKFSRKTTTPRMFFLFSDMFLHTEPAGTDVYKFKNEMPVLTMKVEEPKVSLMAHSFYVESTTRSLILVASSEVEKKEWIGGLRKAINEEKKKRSSLRRDISVRTITGKFGAQAPIMVPDKSVTMCQVCSTLFTFTFRRHHCRGCGKVVCGNCSQWKTYLLYVKRYERVCENCNYIARSESGDSVDAPTPPSPVVKNEGILNIKAYEEDTIKAGYVLSQEGRKLSRLWYQLKQNFCLYKFRAHEDIKAISCHPLPGYIVTSDPATLTITLTHPSSKKQFSDVFKLENVEDFDIWVLALESVVKLEVPTLPSSLSSSSSSSSMQDERWRSQSLRRDIIVTQTESRNSVFENSI